MERLRVRMHSARKFPWYALRIRSRQERTVTNLLFEMGYETYLPLSTGTRDWSDRKKKIETPLFPGYTFCRLNVHDRLPVLTVPGMIQIIGYNRVPHPVEEEEIDAIQTIVASGLQNQSCAYLEAGDRVIVQSGPLAGLEGILVQARGKNRLIVSVNLLQRSISVEISSDFVALRPDGTASARVTRSPSCELECVR